MARQTRKQTNFYSKVNESWQESTEIPKTETRITMGYTIQERINKQLGAIIKSAKPGEPLHSMVSSWIAAENDRIPRGLTPVLQLMLSMSTPSDIASRIGWMNRYGIASPIAIYVQGDPRIHARCRVNIEEGEPRIGIPEYWTETKYVGHREAYARYVDRLATILGLPQLQKGFGAEREFAAVYPIETERRTRIDMLSWSELCSQYRDIDWTAMLTSWGLRDSELPHLSYNITSHAFLHHMQRRFTSWPIDRWSAWFALTVAEWIAGISPQGPLRSAWFDYARRYLQGTPTDETKHELRESVVRSLMPNTLGKLWVYRHCDASLKAEMTTMIGHIRSAAALMLGRTEWMSPSTRLAAVRKLKKMDISVCWPDDVGWSKGKGKGKDKDKEKDKDKDKDNEKDKEKDKDRSEALACMLSDTSLIDNLLTVGAMGTNENLRLLRTGDCRHPSGGGWSKPVYIVNAYYYPDENRFLLPAAILNPPYYDAARSLPWNYGSIGATIGHELCHAFDSDGRTYDEHGNKRDWWTDRDSREFKKKAQQVVRLYESRLYRGLEVDGTLTLVENIADIGGIEFALGGLAKALDREPTKAEFREFFTSYGVSWRSKDRLKRAAELLATNSHSPPALRVNHVVRQFDVWYTTFDVGPDSPEWIPPAKRIHFFA